MLNYYCGTIGCTRQVPVATARTWSFPRFSRTGTPSWWSPELSFWWRTWVHHEDRGPDTQHDAVDGALARCEQVHEEPYLKGDEQERAQAVEYAHNDQPSFQIHPIIALIIMKSNVNITKSIGRSGEGSSEDLPDFGEAVLKLSIVNAINEIVYIIREFRLVITTLFLIFDTRLAHVSSVSIDQVIGGGKAFSGCDPFRLQAGYRVSNYSLW